MLLKHADLPESLASRVAAFGGDPETAGRALASLNQLVAIGNIEAVEKIIGLATDTEYIFQPLVRNGLDRAIAGFQSRKRRAWRVGCVRIVRKGRKLVPQVVSAVA